jgi:fluoroacetyl-CoA thioesterase
MAPDHTPAREERPSVELHYTVVASDSAKQLRLDEGDDFPDVLATSRMVGLMEIAAARQMRPLLKRGELSVGVSLQVEHLAATPVSEQVRAVATYLGLQGKLHHFDVAVFDAGGLVGKGSHTRAIVAPERLIERARRRIADARNGEA